MKQSFAFECPKAIYFGCGERERLPWIISGYGKKAFIITGARWFSESGWKQKITRLLKEFQLEFYPCPAGEPDVESIRALTNSAKTFSPSVIIAIGGGTVLDSAKAASGLVSAPGDITDYLEGIGTGLELKKPGVPWIALPTTAGTGAEATKNAVIKADDTTAKIATAKIADAKIAGVKIAGARIAGARIAGVKKSFRSPFLLADAVIADPDFTLDLPLFISGITGMDALVQLLESFLSKKAKPIPCALSKDAFPLMLASLKKISKHPGDGEARSGALYGSLISGISLANSGLGAVHGFASGLGGLFDIPHGLICAAFLLPVLKANAAASVDAIHDDLKNLCAGLMKNSKDDPVEWLAGEIRELCDAFGIPPDLKKYKIDPALAETIVIKSEGSSMSGNPVELSPEEKKKIILEVI